MTSPVKFDNALHYKLQYSKTVVFLEIVFFSLLGLSLIEILSGLWLWWCLLGLFLLVQYFFRQLSIIHQVSEGLRLEFRVNPPRVICYDHNVESEYAREQIKTFFSPWFVLLQLNNLKRTQRLLLLRDSFQNDSDYARFRRQLRELTYDAS